MAQRLFPEFENSLVKSNAPTLGILGAGKLGTVLARLAVQAGYTVYIAGSGAAKDIELSVKVITPGALAVTAHEAIAQSDVIILALPLGKYKNVPVEALQGKLVIDAMNYWWEVDGRSLEQDIEPSSSEMVQSFLAKSRVVKALSHMGYHHLLDEAKAAGIPDRKAIAVAGDNPADTKQVAHIVNNLGFDPVYLGPLSAGKILEPGNPLFGATIGASELQNIVNNKGEIS